LEAQVTKDPWLELCRAAYTESTSYIDSTFRKKWEDGLSHFDSEHTNSSKYKSSKYKYRSKMFRPKTRAAIRNTEAAAVAAFFSNQDVTSCDAQDQNNPQQAASAKLMEEILNYRLTTSIPWFKICIGGVQDAQVIGVVASYQYWDYKEQVDKETITAIDLDGTPVEIEQENVTVLEDKPKVELLAIENLRIHPSADWMDPIGTSPYVQRLVPMFACDVLERMGQENPKTGEPKWKKYELDEIRHSQKYLFEIARLDREGSEDRYNRPDDADGAGKSLEEYEVVWTIENFMRKDGKDWVFWTLGTEFMLSKPKERKEVYWHGEIPIVMGCAVIETNRIYPSGTAALGGPLQKELNENANQRLDNVKLVMNKRYIGRRGAQIDFDSLLRNVAGSVTLADDPTGDVREMEFNDVTGSSYMEQDRLNLDYDEIVGTFSQSSVQSNRKLNETVGGMEMLQGSSNAITEFTLRTIAETWIEPLMRQLVLLEQMYETDEVVLALAAEKAQLWQKYGMDPQQDQLLEQHLTVSVNVGMGATDPVQKMRNFVGGIRAYAEVASSIPPGTLNMEEVGKEIFGRMGYKDGERFLTNQQQQDPEKMQMQQAMQEMQQLIQQLQAEVEDNSKDRKLKLLVENTKQQHEDARTDKELQADLMLANLKEQHEDVRTDKELQTKILVERMDNASQARQQRSAK